MVLPLKKRWLKGVVLAQQQKSSTDTTTASTSASASDEGFRKAQRGSSGSAEASWKKRGHPPTSFAPIPDLSVHSKPAHASAPGEVATDGREVARPNKEPAKVKKHEELPHKSTIESEAARGALKVGQGQRGRQTKRKGKGKGGLEEAVPRVERPKREVNEGKQEKEGGTSTARKRGARDNQGTTTRNGQLGGAAAERRRKRKQEWEQIILAQGVGSATTPQNSKTKKRGRVEKHINTSQQKTEHNRRGERKGTKETLVREQEKLREGKRKETQGLSDRASRGVRESKATRPKGETSQKADTATTKTKRAKAKMSMKVVAGSDTGSGTRNAAAATASATTGATGAAGASPVVAPGLAATSTGAKKASTSAAAASASANAASVSAIDASASASLASQTASLSVSLEKAEKKKKRKRERKEGAKARNGSGNDMSNVGAQNQKRRRKMVDHGKGIKGEEGARTGERHIRPPSTTPPPLVVKSEDALPLPPALISPSSRSSSLISISDDHPPVSVNERLLSLSNRLLSITFPSGKKTESSHEPDPMSMATRLLDGLNRLTPHLRHTMAKITRQSSGLDDKDKGGRGGKKAGTVVDGEGPEDEGKGYLSLDDFKGVVSKLKKKMKYHKSLAQTERASVRSPHSNDNLNRKFALSIKSLLKTWKEAMNQGTEDGVAQAREFVEKARREKRRKNERRETSGETRAPKGGKEREGERERGGNEADGSGRVRKGPKVPSVLPISKTPVVVGKDGKGGEGLRAVSNEKEEENVKEKERDSKDKKKREKQQRKESQMDVDERAEAEYEEEDDDEDESLSSLGEKEKEKRRKERKRKRKKKKKKKKKLKRKTEDEGQQRDGEGKEWDSQESEESRNRKKRKVVHSSPSSLYLSDGSSEKGTKKGKRKGKGRRGRERRQREEGKVRLSLLSQEEKALPFLSRVLLQATRVRMGKRVKQRKEEERREEEMGGREEEEGEEENPGRDKRKEGSSEYYCALYMNKDPDKDDDGKSAFTASSLQSSSAQSEASSYHSYDSREREKRERERPGANVHTTHATERGKDRENKGIPLWSGPPKEKDDYREEIEGGGDSWEVSSVGSTFSLAKTRFAGGREQGESDEGVESSSGSGRNGNGSSDNGFSGSGNDRAHSGPHGSSTGRGSVDVVTDSVPNSTTSMTSFHAKGKSNGYLRHKPLHSAGAAATRRAPYVEYFDAMSPLLRHWRRDREYQRYVVSRELRRYKLSGGMEFLAVEHLRRKERRRRRAAREEARKARRMARRREKEREAVEEEDRRTYSVGEAPELDPEVEGEMDEEEGEAYGAVGTGYTPHLRAYPSSSASSDPLKFSTKKREDKVRVRFERSRIHSWGVFASHPIRANEFITEYKGEIIRSSLVEVREQRYRDAGVDDYMFRVDRDMVLDATYKGSVARFINHCCDPNCYTQVITIEGEKKIYIYAKRDITQGEELSYDYKFPIEDDDAKKVPCNCRARNCRGTLN